MRVPVAGGTAFRTLLYGLVLLVGALVGPSQAAFWRVGRQVADAIAGVLWTLLMLLRAQGRAPRPLRSALPLPALTHAAA